MYFPLVNVRYPTELQRCFHCCIRLSVEWKESNIYFFGVFKCVTRVEGKATFLLLPVTRVMLVEEDVIFISLIQKQDTVWKNKTIN